MEKVEICSVADFLKVSDLLDVESAFAKVIHVEKGQAKNSIEILVEYFFIVGNIKFSKTRLFGFTAQEFERYAEVKVLTSDADFMLVGVSPQGTGHTRFPVHLIEKIAGEIKEEVAPLDVFLAV